MRTTTVVIFGGHQNIRKLVPCPKCLSEVLHRVFFPAAILPMGGRTSFVRGGTTSSAIASHVFGLRLGGSQVLYALVGAFSLAVATCLGASDMSTSEKADIASSGRHVMQKSVEIVSNNVFSVCFMFHHFSPYFSFFFSFFPFFLFPLFFSFFPFFSTFFFRFSFVSFSFFHFFIFFLFFLSFCFYSLIVSFFSIVHVFHLSFFLFFAAATCKADAPCSVNTALCQLSSLPLSFRCTTLHKYFLEMCRELGAFELVEVHKGCQMRLSPVLLRSLSRF